MRPSSRALVLLLASACSARTEYGGLTADLVFADQPGLQRRALVAESVPTIIARLQIVALDSDGSMLTDVLGNPIETNLVASPVSGEQMLLYGGGEWELSRVPAGENRSVLANAYLGTNVDPRVAGAVAFRGRIDGITVVAGETQNAGTLELISTGIEDPGGRHGPADRAQPGPRRSHHRR